MFQNIPPITRNIIIINIVVYLVTNLFNTEFLYDILSGYYPFSPKFHSWQIITHMFMHAPWGQGGLGITHILFNMLTLWSFGPALEQTLGEKRYLILYFLSGIGAYFLFNLWNFIEVQQVISQLEGMGTDVKSFLAGQNISLSGNAAQVNQQKELLASVQSAMFSPMVGASGAVFGVVAGFATLYPNAKLVFMFIPFPIKAKILLPIIIIASVFLGLGGNVGGIAHFAHVGGALVGFILASIWKKNLYRLN